MNAVKIDGKFQIPDHTFLGPFQDKSHNYYDVLIPTFVKSMDEIFIEISMDHGWRHLYFYKNWRINLSVNIKLIGSTTEDVLYESTDNILFYYDRITYQFPKSLTINDFVAFCSIGETKILMNHHFI